MVINVGAFADKTIGRELCKLAVIREKVLEECYRIQGYEKLPIEEKNLIYDEIRSRYDR